PPSAWYRFRKLARRNKTVLATTSATAVALLLAVGSLAVAVKVLADANDQIKEKQEQTNEALEGEKQAKQGLVEALEREVRASYYRSIQLVDRELEANNPGRAEELLDECPAPLRRWEWHYLKRRHYREPVTFRGHRDWVYCVALSPDGTRAASGGGALSLLRGDLRAWETATGTEMRPLVGHAGPTNGVAFSADGKFLASSSLDRTVRIWDVSTWKTRHALRGHTDYAGGVAFSPDGRSLASGSGDRTVKVWDVATGGEVKTLLGHPNPLLAVGWSPDGSTIAAAGGDFFRPEEPGEARLWDVESGAEVLKLKGH